MSQVLNQESRVGTADLSASTTDAAFAVDAAGRILSWNHGAECLFGLPAEEAVNRPCHEVVCGRDAFGNRYCHESCAILRMARDGEPIRGFELWAPNADASEGRVRVSILVLGAVEDGGPSVLHLMSPIAPGKSEVDSAASSTHAAGVEDEAGSASSRGQARNQALGRRLTRREYQVLLMLSEGASTVSVAQELRISSTTVRNHVQSVLRKLGVHSKLEAVTLALREGIV